MKPYLEIQEMGGYRWSGRSPVHSPLSVQASEAQSENHFCQYAFIYREMFTKSAFLFPGYLSNLNVKAYFL